jgi:hypothetical protein
VHFRCKGTPSWSFPRRAQCRGGWIARFRCWPRHLPQLRRLLRNSGELFRRRRSSLAEGEHTIAFVSSIPFHFSIQSTISWSSPSNPLRPAPYTMRSTASGHRRFAAPECPLTGLRLLELRKVEPSASQLAPSTARPPKRLHIMKTALPVVRPPSAATG